MRALRLLPVFLAAFLVGACGSSSGSESGGPSAPNAPGPPGATATAPGAPPAPVPLALPPSGTYWGATPYTDGTGVEFRVWAPNAKAVAVVGGAANDPSGRRALVAEPGKGSWTARVDGAKAGQSYHFAITGADGTETAKADPRARAISGSDSVVIDPRTYAWKTKSFTVPAREETIVYELFVGAFNAPTGKASGTFTTAIDKLDALKDLGVNTVELMPVNGHGAGGWGYGPQQWYATHTEYGTPDDFRHFVDEAHARGIAVMLDVVFNHYDGYTKDPLYCFDGACASRKLGIYFFENDPYALTPWGPRPNFSTPEVADFFVDNVFQWTTEYQVDGFRHDSVSNIRAIDGQGTVPGGSAVLQRMNAATLQAKPKALVVAEDLKGYAAITAPKASGGLDFVSQWDGGFQYNVATAASAANDADRNLGAIRDSLLTSYNGDPFQRVVYVETHDTAGNDGARLPARIDAADPASYAARKRGMLAAGLLLTAPGMPMLFMGQEWLESVKFQSAPDPLDWSKATTNAPVVAFYKDMIRLRRNLDGASAGLRGKNITVTHQNEAGANKVIAYRRWGNAGDDVMVIVNFGATRYTQYDVGVPAAGAWKVRLDSDMKRYGADFGSDTATAVTISATARDGLPATASIALAPYSMVVLSR